MAHDWVMKYGSTLTHKTVIDAWAYADAMQAEADKRKPSGVPDALKEEWQPDWSQAPEWAKWWAMDADAECYWFENKPELMSATWLRLDSSNVELAPSFNYTGNWQDSLRERPE